MMITLLIIFVVLYLITSYEFGRAKVRYLRKQGDDTEFTFIEQLIGGTDWFFRLTPKNTYRLLLQCVIRVLVKGLKAK